MRTTDNLNEQFIVVDSKDKIIGYRSRKDCHSNKKLIHRSFCIVIFNKQGQILLQKRSQTKDLWPGFFTLSCSGHVGKGETYEEAAHRELQEELGISIPVDLKIIKLNSMEEESEMGAIFTGFSDGPFNINREEVENVTFYYKRDLIEGFIKKTLSLTPGAVFALKELKILP